MNLKRILNKKHDNQELIVYKTCINNISNLTINIRNWLLHITYTTMEEIEQGTSMMDSLAATIDVYTENKFSLPSTIMGLRKGISIIGRAMTLFIDNTYKNLDTKNDVDTNKLMKSMMHTFDLMMSGTRIIMHTLEFELQQMVIGVDIIDKYYKKNDVGDKDINFVVKFKQPNKITGHAKEGQSNGSDK